MAEMKYPNLLKPMTIRSKTFKNRMLTAPLGYGPVDNSGHYLHDENIGYYEALARGGTARVITGDHPVNRYNAGYGGGRLDFYSERLPMEAEKSIEFLVRVCRQHDALVFTEFMHGGLTERPMPSMPGGGAGQEDFTPWGPVTFTRPDGVTVQGMTVEMMESVADDFARCCSRAKALGLDGAMIHGGHNKLIDQFRSRHYNTRADEYGGESLENRCRFPLLLLRRVRERVGEDFLIELRISADEFIEGGITLDETIEFLKILDGAGYVDIIHVSCGLHTDPLYNLYTTAPPFFPNFFNLPMARKIKEAGIKTPLALVNSINDPDMAERVIAEGWADFVAMARQMNIADPYFPRKVQEGRTEHINTCIRCYGCYEGNECGVNPIVPVKYLTNLLYRLPEAREKRRVVVVGGGIAGLKAAETAAEKGHEVILLEKASRLGGLLRYADSDPIKSDIKRFRDNIIKRVTAADNIDIRLGVRAVPELIRELDPYALIVAVGSSPVVPDIPIAAEANAIDVMQVHDEPDRVGENVVVVGSGLTAMELALHLGREGKKVTLAGRRDRLAYHENIAMSVYNPVACFMDEYAKCPKPVETVLSCDITGVTPEGAVGVMSDGSSRVLTAATVIFASGMKSNSEEAAAFLGGIAPYVRMIGDCRKPGKIKHCITSGYYAAIDIEE